MSKFKEFIQKFDMFGRPITLTFDKKGEIYRTFIGGLISLGILIFIIAFSGMST